MTGVASYFLLPAEITPFERNYLRRINRVALLFLAAHVPVFAVVAAIYGTGMAQALALTALTLVGPAVGARWLSNPRQQSVVLGISAMCMAGILVHLGQGPMQIEMHFYFFVLLALETVFANPTVVLASAITVALHHLLLFYLLPASIFNYDATIWTVLVHAFFVVLESIAAMFVGRQFFDNVIGLERIVAARTEELVQRSAAMRLVLDHVTEGLATIDGEGALAPERSTTFDGWFGVADERSTWFELLGRASPAVGQASALAWGEVVSGVMPLEMTLDQMPKRLNLEGRVLDIEYIPVEGDPPSQTLVVIRNVTDAFARAEAMETSAEAVQVLDRAQLDPEGFAALLENGQHLLRMLGAERGSTAPAEVMRSVHTLKGNAGIYGLESIARLCHRIEDQVSETGEVPPATLVAELARRWAGATRLARPVVERRREFVEVDLGTFAEVEAALVAAERTPRALERLRAARKIPVRIKLEQLAHEAARIAGRAGKRVSVEIEDQGIRVDPQQCSDVWLALVHAVRNAVDHGIEAPEARRLRGKPAAGRLTLRTWLEAPHLVVEISDDGAGIDFEALRMAGRQAGLPDATDRQLLFTDGLSTRGSVTEISGRGVGMGAIADKARACRGSVEIESRPGSGTTLRLRLLASEGSTTAPDASSSLNSVPGRSMPEPNEESRACR